MNNIVLYQPEIPQNTGNIMRTCVATNTKLHLIKPLGFELDSAHIKRSGVNYIDKLEYVVYENWDDFKSKNPGKYFYFTRYGKKPHSDFDFRPSNGENIYLVFEAVKYRREDAEISTTFTSLTFTKDSQAITADNIKELS